MILKLLEHNRYKRIFRFIMLALGGLLTGFTLVFPSIGIIEWISIVPSAIALISISEDGNIRRRGIYGYGFFFFVCFYLVNYHWFINLYPLDFVGGMTKPAALAVVLAGWVGLSIFQALAGGLVFVVFAEGAKTKTARCFFPIGAFLAGALWAIFEWSQTLTWAGVPWGRLAIGQTGWLIGAQSASLFGSCFVTFLIVTVNFLIAYAILKVDARRFAATLASAIFIANTLLGTAIYFSYSDKGDPIKISAVQGNISSQEKWTYEIRQKTLDVYEEYTEDAVGDGATIVVWPETALPYNFEDNVAMERYVSRLAKKNGVTILCGAFTYGDDEMEYNSIVAFLPDGSIHETVYSKRHLVPFGEFVPLRKLFEILIPPLTELSMISSDLGEGTSAQVFELDSTDIGSLICFDSIYDELARDSTRSGAKILAISTNDSWFLDSAALDMHNAQAKLRAIENRRYVVRSANTGISSIISPRGDEIASIDRLVGGQITAEVYSQESSTLFTCIGNLFVYLAIAAVVIWLAIEKIIDFYFTKSLDNSNIK